MSVNQKRRHALFPKQSAVTVEERFGHKGDERDGKTMFTIRVIRCS